MKTFLFDTFNQYKRFSESLDIKTALCNKTWVVFNNSGEKEIYIFQEKGKLLISVNGKVTYATWEYIHANKSLIISGSKNSYMVHTAYIDNILFALNIDGTNEYAFLIDENNKQNFQPQSYNDIKDYFQNKEQKLLEKEELDELENERLLEQKRETELRKKSENIKLTNYYFPYVLIMLLSTYIITLAFSFSFWGFIVLIAGGTSIGLFIFKIASKTRVKNWKKKHPNDPVNQYL